MRALLCRRFGTPESLTVEEAPDLPEPAPGQVKIAVHAAGLNFPDVLMVAGKYQVKPPLPFSPGLECAGVVLATGAGVTDLRPGDRVLAMADHGAIAQQLITAAPRVMRIPERMSFEQAAGFPVTYGTTYHALVDRARLQPGQTLLVLGAAGGVGSNAVEIGKLLGATVIAAAGTEAKLELARRAGADHTINYSTQSIKEQVKALTANRGVDVAFDPVGGDAFDQTLRSMAIDGRLLVIGFASGQIPSAPANLILLKSCDVVGVFWGAFAQRQPARSRANMDTLLQWFQDGKLRPPISATYPLERAAEAMAALISRAATGKLIITTGASPATRH